MRRPVGELLMFGDGHIGDGAELAAPEHRKTHIGAADVGQQDAFRLVALRHAASRCRAALLTSRQVAIGAPSMKAYRTSRCGTIAGGA
jgi:hypothetical protein